MKGMNHYTIRLQCFSGYLHLGLFQLSTLPLIQGISVLLYPITLPREATGQQPMAHILWEYATHTVYNVYAVPEEFPNVLLIPKRRECHFIQYN